MRTGRPHAKYFVVICMATEQKFRNQWKRLPFSYFQLYLSPHADWTAAVRVSAYKFI